MEKRGQFYLMAAIIIIIIIFGFIAVKSYVKTEDTKTAVYDLEKEFGLESGKVVDYAIYGNKDTGELIENWTRIYITEKSQNVDDFLVVYGDANSQNMINLTKAPAGAVAIGGASLVINSVKIDRTNVHGNKFSIILGGIEYEFNLEPGKNFIFLIRQGGYVTQHGGGENE